MSSSLRRVVLCLCAAVAVCAASPPRVRHSRHAGSFPRVNVANATSRTVCPFEIKNKIVTMNATMTQTFREVVCSSQQKPSTMGCCNTSYHCVQLYDFIGVNNTEVDVGCACMKKPSQRSEPAPHPDGS